MTDEQPPKDSAIINHTNSNNLPYNELNHQANPNRCDINTPSNSDIPFMNVINNDTDIINHNNNNPPLNNDLNDQNNSTDSDTNECNNNNSISTNNSPYKPNRDLFLNEYNNELFQNKRYKIPD